LLTNDNRLGLVEPEQTQWICERLAWHKVLPLAAALHDPKISRCPRLTDMLSKAILMNMAKEERYHRQVIRIFTALQAASVEYLPFKGPFWACQIYESYHCRHIGDIDILISKENVPKAAQILTQLGYSTHYLEGNMDEELAKRGELAFFPVLAQHGDVPVELHWDPMPSPRFLIKKYLKDEDFKRNAVLHQWRGISFLLPPPEIQLMYHFLHSTCQHQFMRFVHITTLVHFIQKYFQLDWSCVEEMAIANRATTPVYYGLTFADAFWSIPEPARKILKRFKPPRMTRMVAACLPPRQIIHSTKSHGDLRRKLFRAAMSW
jgi:hypothetical protein